MWQCGIVDPQPGIEPVPPVLDTQSLTHWTTDQKIKKKKSLFIGHTMWQCGIVDPQPGLEPAPPVLDTQGLTHWTIREDP